MAEALPSRLADAMKRSVHHINGDMIPYTNPIGSCLTSGDYSDLAIKCGDDIYKVHKLIVCTRSEFFARAVKFGGKVCTNPLLAKRSVLTPSRRLKRTLLIFRTTTLKLSVLSFDTYTRTSMTENFRALQILNVKSRTRFRQ